MPCPFLAWHIPYLISPHRPRSLGDIITSKHSDVLGQASWRVVAWSATAGGGGRREAAGGSRASCSSGSVEGWRCASLLPWGDHSDRVAQLQRQRKRRVLEHHWKKSGRYGCHSSKDGPVVSEVGRSRPRFSSCWRRQRKDVCWTSEEKRDIWVR